MLIILLFLEGGSQLVPESSRLHVNLLGLWLGSELRPGLGLALGGVDGKHF